MMSKTKGFTLIELLVVIAVIALLMAIIMPALGKAKLYAQKIVCRNDIRQQCLGTILYSDEHDTKVPTLDAGNWGWDIAFWSTNQISDFAGFDDNEVFFCPANKIKTSTDARFWQFSWVYSWGLSPAEMRNPVPIRDEESANQMTEFRVPPVYYFFEKSNYPQTLMSGKDATWIDKLANVKAASAVLMIMDNVCSEGNQQNFFEITSGGMWNDFSTYDNSNHPSSHKFPGTNYIMPDGGNVGFADGHVDWRDFEDMEPQLSSGIVWWW